MHIDATTAVVLPEKLRDYLLSPTHPIGRYKYAFFQSLGYTQETWERLAADFLALLRTEALALDVTEYGQKVAVRGTLTGPNGRSGEIVIVWIILRGETHARFVTAYPEG